MKKILVPSLIAMAVSALASVAQAQTAPAEPESTLSYNVGAVTEYRYRGISQSGKKPAVQFGADFVSKSGFYVGGWASTITWIRDSTKPSTTKGPLEVDIYGGYKFEAAGLAYDVGYLRYEYVGNTYDKIGVNANTDEVYGAVTAGPATLKYSYAFSDLFGNKDSKGSTYWDLSATFDLGQGYSIVPHAGHQTVKNNANSYTDIALTLNKDFGEGLVGSVSAISTNGKADVFTPISTSGYNSAKSIVVVGVKYSF